MTGRVSYFLRTTYCNLRCAWGETACDSAYTSHAPEGESRSLTDIVREVRELEVTHVVITGGEPCMWREQMKQLARRLQRWVEHITLETNGTLYIPDLHVDLVSISPKLSSSTPQTEHGFPEKSARIHGSARVNYEAFRKWIANYDYQLKFVVYEPIDFEEIESMLTGIESTGLKIDPARVFLMPEGITAEECWERCQWIVPYCIEKNYSLAPRIHLDLFGCERGT